MHDFREADDQLDFNNLLRRNTRKGRSKTLVDCSGGDNHQYEEGYLSEINYGRGTIYQFNPRHNTIVVKKR